MPSWALVKSRWEVVGKSAGWSPCDMGCFTKPAWINKVPLGRGVILAGKDVTWGINSVGALPTKRWKPLEEATGPATNAGVVGVMSITADNGRAKLSTVTARHVTNLGKWGYLGQKWHNLGSKLSGRPTHQDMEASGRGHRSSKRCLISWSDVLGGWHRGSQDISGNSQSSTRVRSQSRSWGRRWCNECSGRHVH